MKFVQVAVTAACVAAAPACQQKQKGKIEGASAAAAAAGPTTASGSRIRPAASPESAAEWRRPSGDYAAIRYSALDEISAANVKALKLAWTFSTGVVRGHEAAPLVVGDTMYVTTPYPNVVYALDLGKPGAPPKWADRPSVERAAQGVACCDVVNRGAAFAEGKVVFNTLDDHTIAIDAKDGHLLWDAQLGDINKGETMTMAPLVAKGKVLVGNSGGEMGVRGWITALSLSDGKVAWKAYSTGPDTDVLIGPEFKPYYASDQGRDLGVSSWPPDMWKVGGGTVWGWISYDPELDLVYYGTGNPGPWNPDQRPGDNKWTAGMFARDLDTGHARWAYQWSPHDVHDYDGINELVLLDMPVGGRTRKVLVRPERNGYMYVLDRTTGEVLSADPIVAITTSKGVDLQTGRPTGMEEKAPHVGTVTRAACPASPGAKDWQPSSFSPRTGLLYVPYNNLCQDAEGVEANYIEGTPFVGMNVKMYAGPGGNRGGFFAWDPIARRKVWEGTETFPAWSGAMATAGDVVFYGTMEGWFKALDAKTGQELWRFKAGSGIIGQPIAYRGPDGKEYVAVYAGVGGWAGAVVAGALDVRDGTAALGFVNAMADLPQHTTAGGMLYVFSLP